jgi:hypothetical protein
VSSSDSSFVARPVAKGSAVSVAMRSDGQCKEASAMTTRRRLGGLRVGAGTLNRRFQPNGPAGTHEK